MEKSVHAEVQAQKIHNTETSMLHSRHLTYAEDNANAVMMQFYL